MSIGAAGNVQKLAASFALPLKLWNGDWFSATANEFVDAVRGIRTRLSVASFGLVLGGYCVDALLSQSKGITKLLSGELTIERDGQRLVLRNADGVVQVVLGP